MEQKHRGSLSELKACAWLLEQGYEVFRNVSAHGVYDIVAVKPETKETRYIDVTTGRPYLRKDGELRLGIPTDKLKKNCDVLVVVPDEEHPDYSGRVFFVQSIH